MAKEYIRESKEGKTYRARLVRYPKELNPNQERDKFNVAIFRLGPFYWDAMKHHMFDDESEALELYKEYCQEVKQLTKGGKHIQGRVPR